MSGEQPGTRSVQVSVGLGLSEASWRSWDHLEGLRRRGTPGHASGVDQVPTPRGGGAVGGVGRWALVAATAQRLLRSRFGFISGAVGVEGGVRQDKDKDKVLVSRVWDVLALEQGAVHLDKVFFPCLNPSATPVEEET